MRKLKQQPISLRGPIGPMSPISPISPMSPRGPLALLLLLALLLGACCHDDDEKPVQEKGTPITFSGSEAETKEVAGARRSNETNGTNGTNETDGTYRTYRTQGGTRAATPLSDLGITRFRVYGFKNTGNDVNYPTYQMVFPTSGYTVEWEANTAATTSTNTSNWEYILTSHPDQTVKFWDLSAAAYRFAARTTSIEATENISVNAVTHDTELTLTIPGLYSDHVEDAPYVSKLWFSNGNPSTYPDKQFLKPVVLEFVKPFSHVRFMFVSADPSVKIEDMELIDMQFKPTDGGGIGINGSVVVTYPITGTTLRETFDSTPSKTITGFTQDYTEDIYFTAAEATAYNSDHGLTEGQEGYKTEGDVRIAGSYLWYTVLPVSSQGSFTLSLSVYGEPRTAVVPAGYMTWKAGYQYTYIFKVSGDGGVEFGDLLTAFTGWSEGFTGVEAVYNW